MCQNRGTPTMEFFLMVSLETSATTFYLFQAPLHKEHVSVVSTSRHPPTLPPPHPPTLSPPHPLHPRDAVPRPHPLQLPWRPGLLYTANMELKPASVENGGVLGATRVDTKMNPLSFRLQPTAAAGDDVVHDARALRVGFTSQPKALPPEALRRVKDGTWAGSITHGLLSDFGCEKHIVLGC